MGEFTIKEACALLKPESAEAYKYSRGHVLVIAGSAEYSGAPFLCGEAALRTGAGMCTVAIPHGCRPYCAVPASLIVRTIAATNGHFSMDSVDQILQLAQKADCLAIGPGITTADAMADFLDAILGLDCPMVLDADALNIMAANPRLFRPVAAPRILTPHAGELKRLQAALSCASAGEIAKMTGWVVVEKGSRTKVWDNWGNFTENTTGCPALATAGSGDCLTGIIAAFMAGKMPALDAARLGVFLHGLVGDILGKDTTRGHIADDIPTVIPDAFRTIAKYGK